MDQPGWKSLLGIDRLLEAWQSPDTAAPQRMTLLKHVADLAAAVDPAARQGDENAIPVAGKDVTSARIAETLDSDGGNKDWDAATLRDWAELARQDPDKAKKILAEVSAQREAGAKAAAAPTGADEIRKQGKPGPSPFPMTVEGGQDGESAWSDGAATPKSPPEGRIRIETRKPKPLSGDIQSLLPSLQETLEVETPGGEEPKPARKVDTYSLEDVRANENMLRGLLARLEPTNDDLNTLVSVADDLKRQKEADPDAFAKRPEIARKFLTHFEATTSDTLDSLLRRPREVQTESKPNDLAELYREAARKAHNDANKEMTMAAAVRTAGEKGRNPERDQEFGMAGVDPVLFRPGEIKSQDDLKKALAAAGPGAFIVGTRPLPGSLYRDPEAGSLADIENREVHHQHIFYLDSDGNLRDAGFFGDGIRKGQEGRDKRQELQAGESDELDNLGQYRFGHIENGGDLRPETFDLKGFDASNYRLWTHNCQTYVEAVQKMVRQAREAAPRN